jgi:zinc protease
MRRAVLAALAALAFAAPAAAVPKGDKTTTAQPDVKRWQLANGLEVLFVADHKAPVVTVQMVYHVGAKDEPEGKRGMAHMFEHMMFKGSTHVPPEEHARFIASMGGSYNASTEDDRILTYNNVPPSALDFTVKLEAERMRGLQLTQKTIDSEREVVKEELRKNEQQPVYQAFKLELATAYSKHPYMMAAAGERKYLDTVTVDDCLRFYDKFFRPNNAMIIVAGDTDEASVRASVEKYFAAMEKGPAIVRDLPQEPAQTEERSKTITLTVQLPVIIGGYHIPAGANDDLYALGVLNQILSGGESARLNQRLVRKDHTAVAAFAGVLKHEDPGLFITAAVFLPGADVGKIQAALDEEVAKVAAQPVDAHELAKAKNQLAAQAVYRRERVEDLASSMAQSWIVEHDPMHPFNAAEKYDAVTAADVQRVAKKYLVTSNRSLVTMIPKPAAKGGAK